jgi:hypothetical protein
MFNYTFTYVVEDLTTEETNINLVTQIRFIHCILIKNELDFIIMIKRRPYVAHLQEPMNKSSLEDNKELVDSCIETALGEDQISLMQNLLKTDCQEENVLLN